MRPNSDSPAPTDQIEGVVIPSNLRSADRFQPRPVLWLITAVAVSLSRSSYIPHGTLSEPM